MDKEKITLEFIFRASPAMIYKFLTAPACLTRWFCDAVDITNDTYTFSWSGADEEADVIEDVEDQRVRFRWEDAESDDEYLDFNIFTSPITGETILEVTFFAEEDETEDQSKLWESQITRLRQEIGG